MELCFFSKGETRFCFSTYSARRRVIFLVQEIVEKQDKQSMRLLKAAAAVLMTMATLLLS